MKEKEILTIVDNNIIFCETDTHGVFRFNKINNSSLEPIDMIIIKYVFNKYLSIKYKDNYKKIARSIFININSTSYNYDSYGLFIVHNINEIDYLLDYKTNGIKKSLKVLYPRKK